MNSESLVNCLSETINILREKKNIFRMPKNFTIGVYMYIAPSSGHSLLNLNVPFNLILRSFEVVL